MVLNKSSNSKNTVKSRSFSSGFAGDAPRGQKVSRTSQGEAALPSESRFVRTASGNNKSYFTRTDGNRGSSNVVRHEPRSNSNHNSSVSFQSPSKSKHDGPAFNVSPMRHSMEYMYTGPSGHFDGSRHGSPGRGGRNSGSSSPTPFVVPSSHHSMAYPYTGPSGSGVLTTGKSGGSAAAPFKAGSVRKAEVAATKASTHRDTYPAHSLLVNDYEHDMAMHEYEEPYNQRGASVADSVVHRENARHQSEQSRQYPWPANTEPSRSYRPAVSHSPIVTGDAYTDADMYQSEYAVRCAELKAKQRELMAKAAASQAAGRERAGVKSAAREALDRVAGAAPSVIPYNVGLSESKMKFTWKEGEPAVPVAPAADKLNLFRTADADLDVLRNDREMSVAKQDYVLHAASDIMRGIQERTENHNNANVKASMSLAWDDTEAEPRPLNKPVNRSTRDNYGPGQAFSEYTRKYTWKDADHERSPTRPKQTPVGENLNLFGGKTDLGASSEYNLQYVNHDLSDARFTPEPIAGVVSKNDGVYPANFAWDGANLNDDDDDDNKGHRRINPLNNPNVLSEYNRKYLWKDPEPRASPTKQLTVAEGGAEGSILGLDRHALQTSEWRSEYEDTYARTALDASRGVYLSPVAGVSTRRTGEYPTNYAWKDEPPKAVVPSPKRRNPADIPMSEYEAKFYEMPRMEPLERPKPKKVAEGERLNLFDEDANAVSAARQKSEYAASFKAFDVNDRVKSIKAKVSENPAQFAWSVIDGEAPKPVYVKKTPSGPVETSEYNSKYQWLQGDNSGTHLPPPAGIVSNVIPGVSAGNPIAEAPESVSEWASEASRSAVNLRANNTNSIPAAGLRTSLHGDIPTFYAWEPEVQPVIHKPVRFPGEVVHSEYEDRFKAWTVGNRPSPSVPSAVHNDTQLDLFGERKPFVETSEHRDQFVQKAAVPAAPLVAAGRSKGPQEDLPTQFAWSLVDGERVKEPVRRPVNPNAIQLSEYETKYSWPQAAERPSSTAPKKAADNEIFPPEKSVKDWKSEADARFTALPPAAAAATGTAGIPSEKTPAAPSFYAWPEVPPSEAPPAPQYKWDPVQSECHDKFINKALARSEPVKLHDTLNLFVPKQPFDREKPEGVTEYDDKFRGVGTAAASAAPTAVPPAVDHTPHQFAWPLIDGERKKEPVQYSPDHPFYGTTEHDAQYNWPSTKDTLACRTLIKPASAFTGKSSVILPTQPPVPHSEAWQSEYDARCAILKSRQQAATNVAKVENEVPPAGVPTIRAQHSPSNFAWRKTEKAQTPVEVSRSSLNGVTEYDAQFGWKSGNKAKAPADLPDVGTINSLAITKDSLDVSNRLNPNGLPFVGRSEYDDKFVSGARAAEDSGLKVSAPRVNNADLPAAGMSSELLHHEHTSAAAASAAPRPHHSHVSSGAVGYYSTETSDKFSWQSRPQPQEPTHIAQKDGVKTQCSACHGEKENVHSNSSFIGESESRSKFSWPTRRKITTTSGVSHTAPRKVSPGRRVYYSNTSSPSRQQQEVAYTRPVSSFSSHEESASVHSSGTSTVTTVDNSKTQQVAAAEDTSSNRVVVPTTATTATIESNSSTLGTSTKKSSITATTPVDSQQSVASSNCGASSSTITSVRIADATTDNVARSGARNASYIDFQKKNRLNAGLRYPLDNYQTYRSRSAPPRRLVSQSFTDNRYKAKMFVDQDTTNNPVLLHKRYPQNSDRQLGRWSTETSDKFNWKRVTTAVGGGQGATAGNVVSGL